MTTYTSASNTGYTISTNGNCYTNITLSPTATTSGSSSVVYSTGSGYTWAQPTTNLHNGNGDTLMTIPAGGKEIVLEEKATLDVKGTVKINGIDLEERLNTIEKVLQIPSRDVIMETKHPKLAELYKQYMHELEKYRTFERIKGEEDGTT